jgi:putative ABC transport system permease protein
MLIKTPGFAIIAILTLALGIGANSALFSVIDTVLLRPLPFKNPDQLVMVWNLLERGGNARDTVSFPDFYDYRAKSQSFNQMAYYGEADTVLGRASEARAVTGVCVGGDFFETLGAPVLGRGFTAEEAKAGGPNVVVISHGLWQRAFAGNPAIVGEQVTMTSRTYTILGVMGSGRRFPVEATASDFIIPYEPLVTDVTNRGLHNLKLIGRLKPGVSIKQAEPEMKAIAAELERQYPNSNAGRTITLAPLLQEIVGNVRPALLVLLGAVVLVLLIACANVANLLLARAATRSREIGIRVALGANRAGIIRQLLIESLYFGVHFTNLIWPFSLGSRSSQYWFPLPSTHIRHSVSSACKIQSPQCGFPTSLPAIAKTMVMSMADKESVKAVPVGNLWIFIVEKMERFTSR